MSLLLKQRLVAVYLAIAGSVSNAFRINKDDLVLVAFAHPENKVRQKPAIFVHLFIEIGDVHFVQGFVDLAEHPGVPLRFVAFVLQPLIQRIEKCHLALHFHDVLDEIRLCRLARRDHGQIVMIGDMLDCQLVERVFELAMGIGFKFVPGNFTVQMFSQQRVILIPLNTALGHLFYLFIQRLQFFVSQVRPHFAKMHNILVAFLFVQRPHPFGGLRVDRQMGEQAFLQKRQAVVLLVLVNAEVVSRLRLFPQAVDLLRR